MRDTRGDGPAGGRDAGSAARSGELEEIPARRIVLACGHSARDTFELLFDEGLRMEQKPFSMGVRIEHLQRSIDRAQYGKAAGHPALGAADYKLAVHLPDGRGVYTFCMCPGGQVVCAASEEEGVCVNGVNVDILSLVPEVHNSVNGALSSGTSSYSGSSYSGSSYSGSGSSYGSSGQVAKLSE